MVNKLLENIVKKLVEKPDSVMITQTEANDKHVIRVIVARADLRRVIGSGGRVFRALKTLVFLFSRTPTDLFVGEVPETPTSGEQAPS